MLGVKKTYLTIAALGIAVGAVIALNGAAAGAVSSYRDCEDDTIIRCGAITESELLQKYDQNIGDAQRIYAHYGINRGDLAGTTSEIKHGTVYQDGRVVVDGKTVATNAYSLSRLPFNDKNGNKPRTITVNGVALYEGPNMSIFLKSVDAYVYFRDGQFYKAILSACGNPLIAVPTPKPVKPVKPEVPKTPETPVVPEKPVTPVTPVTPETPVELPKTGLESLLGSSLGLGSLAGAGYYWVNSRKNLASTIRNK